MKIQFFDTQYMNDWNGLPFIKKKSLHNTLAEEIFQKLFNNVDYSF